MSLSFLGDAIQGSASHINALFNGLMARSQQKKQNEYNRQMMDEMNEYNSPVNQSLRLMQAGLNPNLSYGSITPGIQSHPTEKGVPDYSEMQQNLSDAGKSAGNAAKSAYLDSITQKQLKLQEKNLELQGKRLDNEIERTDIKRSLANVAVRKGDFQVAALALDNRWKAMTLYDRVKSERWKQELLGYKTDTARAEATYAPDFYDLRNQQARLNLWYRPAMVAVARRNAATAEGNLAYRTMEGQRRYELALSQWANKKEMNRVLYEQILENIKKQQEMVKVAKTAEERKQREQTLHYMFKLLEDIEKIVVDFSPVTTFTSPSGLQKTTYR